MKKNVFLLMAFVAMILWSGKAVADNFACGDNSYNPVQGLLDPLDFDTFKFKDGGRYVLVYHKDELGSYVLAPNGGVGAGVELVLKLYVPEDKTMEFIMEDAGDGTFFLRSVLDENLVVTGGGNMSVPKLMEFENVTNIGEQMYALAYCDQSELEGYDAFTMFNVYFGAAIESNNQNVYENAPLIHWKNFGAFHPVNMDDPDYTFVGSKQFERPSNATFNPENVDETKKYAFVYSKGMSYENNQIKGMGLKVTDAGAVLSDYTGGNEFLYTARKMGDAVQFKNVANGKVLMSQGTNMEKVTLMDEGSLDNEAKGLWGVKDVKEEGVFGLAFLFANKLGAGGFVPSNYSPTEGNEVMIWADGDKWYLFDAAISGNPFEYNLTNIENNVYNNAQLGTVYFVQGTIRINVPHAIRMVISNLAGQTNLNEPIAADADEICVASLEKGVYLVKVLSADGQLLNVSKIIVY